jgi:hypothetical protein
MMRFSLQKRSDLLIRLLEPRRAGEVAALAINRTTLNRGIGAHNESRGRARKDPETAMAGRDGPPLQKVRNVRTG